MKDVIESHSQAHALTVVSRVFRGAFWASCVSDIRSSWLGLRLALSQMCWAESHFFHIGKKAHATPLSKPIRKKINK